MICTLLPDMSGPQKNSSSKPWSVDPEIRIQGPTATVLQPLVLGGFRQPKSKIGQTQTARPFSQGEMLGEDLPLISRLAKVCFQLQIFSYWLWKIALDTKKWLEECFSVKLGTSGRDTAIPWQLACTLFFFEWPFDRHQEWYYNQRYKDSVHTSKWMWMQVDHTHISVTASLHAPSTVRPGPLRSSRIINKRVSPDRVHSSVDTFESLANTTSTFRASAERTDGAEIEHNTLETVSGAFCGLTPVSLLLAAFLFWFWGSLRIDAHQTTVCATSYINKAESEMKMWHIHTDTPATQHATESPVELIRWLGSAACEYTPTYAQAVVGTSSKHKHSTAASTPWIIRHKWATMNPCCGCCYIYDCHTRLLCSIHRTHCKHVFAMSHHREAINTMQRISFTLITFLILATKKRSFAFDMRTSCLNM